MASAEFEQRLWIDAALERARDALTTLAAHSELHPLIVAVEELPAAADANGSARRRYRITDRVHLGPLKMTVRYLAETGVDAQGAVVSDAWQSPGVHLHVVTRLTPRDGGVQLDERVAISAPGPLIGSVRRQAQASHQALFANLKRMLEAQRDPGARA